VRHDLESGAWIEITPLQDLKGKDRDRFDKVMRFGLPVTEVGDFDSIRAVAERLDTREVRRNAAMACFITAWSFGAADGTPLPVPGLDELGRIAHPEVIGDYPIDDGTEIEAILAPYLVKLRRPDPKETTTSTSNGRSKARASSLKG
jgi:hypothetical protein